MHSNLSTLPGRGPLVFVCEVCGSPFRRRPGDLAKSTPRFCSRACWKTQPARDPLAYWKDHLGTAGEHWLWTGPTNPQGYGRITIDGHHVLTHRFALEQAMGRTLPSDILALHTCDIPACNRNDDEGWYEVGGIQYPRYGHLWAGTHQANNLDMMTKGRQARGIDRGGSKFKPEDIYEIRQSAANGTSQRTLATAFGVTQTTIGRIIRRQIWAHIT